MAQVYNKTYAPEKWEKVNAENKSIIDDYILECKSKKKAEGTIQQYYNDARIVAIYCLEHLDNRSFLNLTKRDFRNFMLHAQDEWKLSAARCNRILSCIHQILDFCEDDTEVYEDYTKNISEKIKCLRDDGVRDIVFVEDDVITQLYDKFMKEKRYKEATLLAILYDSGCRKNEIAQVERNTITKTGNSTNMVKGKRGKKFRVLYFERTKQAFAKYEATRKDESTLLFPCSEDERGGSNYIYKAVKKWADDLKEITGKDYEGLTVHSFRHSFVENCIRGTHYICRDYKTGPIPLEKVKALCHHESSDTTLGYAKNNEEKDIEDLFGIKIN